MLTVPPGTHDAWLSGMTSDNRVRGALSTLADFTFGTVIAMVQIAMADRDGSRWHRHPYDHHLRAKLRRELE